MTHIEKYKLEPGWLAQNLRALRSAQNVSQARMANELGVSTATIHNIEDGSTKNPGVPLVRAIAHYLNVPFGDFVEKDLSELGQLECAIKFMQEHMTEPEQIAVIGSVNATRKVKREAGCYRQTDTATKRR